MKDALDFRKHCLLSKKTGLLFMRENLRLFRERMVHLLHPHARAVQKVVIGTFQEVLATCRRLKQEQPQSKAAPLFSGGYGVFSSHDHAQS